MYIPVESNDLRFVALADTGASGYAFVSNSLASRLSLTRKPVPRPFSVMNFQNESGGYVQEYVKFHVRMGHHVEELMAYVSPSDKYDLMLGLPWFEKHNPSVDWKNHSLSFNAEGCLGTHAG